jgi:hypothetical protein
VSTFRRQRRVVRSAVFYAISFIINTSRRLTILIYFAFFQSSDVCYSVYIYIYIYILDTVTSTRLTDRVRFLSRSLIFSCSYIRKICESGFLFLCGYRPSYRSGRSANYREWRLHIELRHRAMCPHNIGLMQKRWDGFSHWTGYRTYMHAYTNIEKHIGEHIYNCLLPSLMHNACNAMLSNRK